MALALIVQPQNHTSKRKAVAHNNMLALTNTHAHVYTCVHTCATEGVSVAPGVAVEGWSGWEATGCMGVSVLTPPAGWGSSGADAAAAGAPPVEPDPCRVTPTPPVLPLGGRARVGTAGRVPDCWWKVRRGIRLGDAGMAFHNRLLMDPRDCVRKELARSTREHLSIDITVSEHTALAAVGAGLPPETWRCTAATDGL